MTYTVRKKTFLLWSLLLSSLIFAWCSTKSVEQPIQPEPVPVVEETQAPITEAQAPIVETQTATTIQTDNSSYTIQDIQAHKTRKDCRTIVNNKVYNITSAFGKHEWWDDLLATLCWIEWTIKFNTQHWWSDKAKSRINTLQIWTLK